MKSEIINSILTPYVLLVHDKTRFKSNWKYKILTLKIAYARPLARNIKNTCKIASMY